MYACEVISGYSKLIVGNNKLLVEENCFWTQEEFWGKCFEIDGLSTLKTSHGTRLPRHELAAK